MKKYLTLATILFVTALFPQMMLGQASARYLRIQELKEQKGVKHIELLGQLHKAILQHDKTTVLAILDELPLIDDYKYEVSSNTTWNGTTALIVAVKASDEEIIRILLEANKETELGKPASPSFTDSLERTPLFYATTPRIAQMLLQTGDLNVSAKDKYGKTALEVLLDKLYNTPQNDTSFIDLLDTVSVVAHAMHDPVENGNN